MMKYICHNKGQGLVEFAIVLAFLVFLGIYGREAMYATDVLFERSAPVLREIEHHRTFDVSPAINEVLSKESFYKAYGESGLSGEGNSSGKIHWMRGMIRSGWIEKEGHETDAENQYIKELSDELGASQWSYLNGLGQNYYAQKYKEDGKWKTYGHNSKNSLDLMYAVNNLDDDAGMYIGDKGLYWTVQALGSKDLHPVSNHEKENYSAELVLQYFYSTYTERYYVIKGPVWINQGDVYNRVNLGGLHQQYFKPAGYFVNGCVDGFATLAEAKELFEEVRRKNGYDVVFTEADEVNDISAADYVIENNRFVPDKNKYEKHEEST